MKPLSIHNGKQHRRPNLHADVRHRDILQFRRKPAKKLVDTAERGHHAGSDFCTRELKQVLYGILILYACGRVMYYIICQAHGRESPRDVLHNT